MVAIKSFDLSYEESVGTIFWHAKPTRVIGSNYSGGHKKKVDFCDGLSRAADYGVAAVSVYRFVLLVAPSLMIQM